MTSQLSSPVALAGPLSAITSAVAAAANVAPNYFAVSVPAASVALANAPFTLSAGAAAPAAGGGSSSGTVAGAALGCAAGVVALACALWARRSYAKHNRLPCCRDRVTEARKRDEMKRLAEEAAEVERELAVVSPLRLAEAAGGEASPASPALGGAKPVRAAFLVRELSRKAAITVEAEAKSKVAEERSRASEAAAAAALAGVAELRRQLSAHEGRASAERAAAESAAEAAELRRQLDARSAAAPFSFAPRVVQ